MESAAADHFVCDQAKPTLDLIEPRTAGRREMEMEAATLFGLEPALNSSALVGAVVVKDEMDIQLGREFFSS